MICLLIPEYIITQIEGDFPDKCPLDIISIHAVLKRNGDQIVSDMYQVKKAKISTTTNYQKYYIYLNLAKQYQLNKKLVFQNKVYKK